MSDLRQTWANFIARRVSPHFAGALDGHRRFLKDTSGSVLIYVGLTSFVFLGFAGLAVDVGHWYASKRTMQSAADAAAIGGVFAVKKGSDKATIVSMAKNDAALNGYDLTKGAVVTINNPPLSGPNAGDTSAIEVIIQQPVPGFFSKVVFSGPTNITARAVAGFGSAPVCLMALDPTLNQAMKVNNGTVIANGCAVQVNSDDDDDALEVTSGGVLEAESINVVGGYDADGLVSPTPESGAAPISDPLAGMAAPSFSGCDEDGLHLNSGTETLSPGVYCDGISLSNDVSVTFEPGTYIITGGKFSTSSNVSMQGEGVFFYLDGNKAVLDFSGGDVDFSAPTTGPYAGMLFYGDRNTNKNLKHNISGGANIALEGTVYLPLGDLEVTGNGSIGSSDAAWTVLIANELKFGGNGEFVFNSNYGSSDVPVPAALGGASGTIALIE